MNVILTVQEAKEYLRIEHDSEDDLIRKLIQQAQAAAEDYCRVSFEDMDKDDIPKAARLAIIVMVAHFYENRDQADTAAYKGMRMAFESLLYPCRDPERMF